MPPSTRRAAAAALLVALTAGTASAQSPSPRPVAAADTAIEVLLAEPAGTPAQYISNAGGLTDALFLGLAVAINILGANTVPNPSGITLIGARACDPAADAGTPYNCVFGPTTTLLDVSISDPLGIYTSYELNERFAWSITGNTAAFAPFTVALNAAAGVNVSSAVPSIAGPVLVGFTPPAHDSKKVGEIVGGWVGAVFLTVAAVLAIQLYRSQAAKARAAREARYGTLPKTSDV